MRKRRVLVAVCAALLVGGCGGSEDSRSSEPDDASDLSSSGSSSAPAADPGDPEQAIQDYFTAMRTGDSAAICAMEDETYQALKYDSAGQACLDDLGNQRSQPVWAEEVVVVSIEETETSATAVVQPNASTPAEATISLAVVDGAWKVTSFA